MRRFILATVPNHSRILPTHITIIIPHTATVLHPDQSHFHISGSYPWESNLQHWRIPMGRKQAPFNPKVRIRLVSYHSDELRRQCREMYQRTIREAEKGKRRMEMRPTEPLLQPDDFKENLESASACGALADCPLVPILQRCTRLREALERAL